MLPSFLISVSIIEDKLMILDVLSYSIYFNFRFVNPDPRITARNRVYFSCLVFFLKKRSFTDTNAYVHL